MSNLIKIYLKERGNMATSLKKGKQFKLGDLNLDLRLTGKSVVSIEKRLGKSIMNLFIDGRGGDRMPPVNEVLIILQGANQTHGVSDKDIITNFDKYFDNGGDTLSLFNVVMELLEESGFFGKKDKDTKTNSESETLDATTTEEETTL